MNEHASNEYFSQKKILLKQCLVLSEELIGSIESWESVPGIVAGKDAVILQLKELEETTDAEVKALLSEERKQELNQLIKLIQDLDQDATRLIRKEQESIMHSMKANTQGQKLMQYAQAPEPGRKLDYKK